MTGIDQSMIFRRPIWSIYLMVKIVQTILVDATTKPAKDDEGKPMLMKMNALE